MNAGEGPRPKSLETVFDRGRTVVLAVPVIFVAVFLIAPLVLTFSISFWQRTGFRIRPAFQLSAYHDFFTGVRLFVLERGVVVAAEVTAIGLVLAYPIAYFLCLDRKSVV